MYNILKKYIFQINYIFVFSVIIFSFTPGLSAEIDEMQNYKEIDEIHQEMVNLVLTSSPSLDSQQNLVDEYQDITFPESGKSTSLDLDLGVGTETENNETYAAPELGLNLNYPLLDPGAEYNHFDRRLSFINDETGQTEKLEEMEKELITELNSQLTELIELINQYQGQEQLKNRLEERNQEIKEMVEAGITDPENLWELDERINEIEIELNNLESKELILINEISRNFGKENKGELKEKLQEITSILRGVDNNE